MSRQITLVQQAIEAQMQMEVFQGKLIRIVESMTLQQKVIWEKWLERRNEVLGRR